MHFLRAIRPVLDSAWTLLLALVLLLRIPVARGPPPPFLLALVCLLHQVQGPPPALLLALVCLLRAPAVQGFPIVLGPPPASISTTFRYPGLSLAQGMRNIHSLELLENIGNGYFRIGHVGPPVRYGEFVTVGVKCSVRGQNHTLLVMSRPDQAHIATLVCLRDNVQRAAFTLRASRLTPDGHTILLESTCFDSKRVLYRDLRPVMRFLAFYGDRAGWGGEAFKAHPNLAWYRRMVLGLPPPQPEQDSPI